MPAPFRRSRLVTSLVALVIVMSSAGANAQSPQMWGQRGRRIQGRFGRSFRSPTTLTIWYARRCSLKHLAILPKRSRGRKAIAVGAGVGLVIDLLRSNTLRAWRPQSDDRFQMNIAGGRKAVGVRGILRWR
jgi:hypothetical protein